MPIKMREGRSSIVLLQRRTYAWMGLSLLLDYDVLDGWDHELSQRRWNRFAGFKTTPASQHHTEENTLEQGDENTLSCY